MTVRDARGRPIRELDRHGAVVAELSWDATGLAHARVRVAGGGWLDIEPRATTDAPWGLSDAVAQDGRRLTVFSALDWEAVDRIPILAEPARVPAGGGTAILNLVAALAADQGHDRLVYQGPYPTEALFLALLESFRYTGGKPDPLAAFMRGEIAWTPAPHEREFAAEGVYVQRRDGRVEKIVARGRAYYRPDWQGIRRHAPRRVRDVGGGVRGSLWMLDTALEDLVSLGADGRVHALPAPDPDPACVRPVSPPLRHGLLAAVAATSAPALGAAIHAAADALALEWGPVPGDLLSADADRLRLSARLYDLVARRLGAVNSQAERVHLGFAALTELALLVGDDLRRRAQRWLAAAPPGAQAAALETGAHEPDARAIGAAVAALLEAQPLA